jgi:3-oxoacyl-[acyl-carrier protein] reductase
MNIDLTGRTALVTGASRGIGKEIAMALGAAGANVACIATNEALLQEVVGQIPNGLAIKTDVTKGDEVNAAVKQTVEKFGGLDILVNNAGITRDNLLIRMKEEEWDPVIEINLKAPYRFIKAASRSLLRSKHGRVINISSIAGIMGNPGQANYSASKGGLIAMTKSAAREYASRGVTVNAIAPGFIRTDMVAQMDEKKVEAALEGVPLKRMGETKEIASAVVYLAGDGAAYITGQTIVIDGGMSM